MIDIFNGFYHGKRVLVTGHTGFKGSWLSTKTLILSETITCCPALAGK